MAKATSASEIGDQVAHARAGFAVVQRPERRWRR